MVNSVDRLTSKTNNPLTVPPNSVPCLGPLAAKEGASGLVDEAEGLIEKELWSGRLAPLIVPHAALGVIRGFIPPVRRQGRGMCAIRSSQPDLWVPAVMALGFTIDTIRYQSSSFRTFLQGVGYSCPGDTTCASMAAQVVFSDALGLLELLHQTKYWATRLVPHVFYKQTEALLPPAGWTERSLTLAHCELGGSTDAIWTLVVWYPPAHVVHEPTVLASQPWFPVSAVINRRVLSVPAPAPTAPPTLIPTVQYSGRDVLSCGLFPAKQPGANVLVPDDWSPTGWGTRSLTVAELGSVWDVPIGMLDYVAAFPPDAHWVRSLVDGPPGKMLQLGTDLLLTAEFRGGGDDSSRASKAGAKRPLDRASVSVTKEDLPSKRTCVDVNTEEEFLVENAAACVDEKVLEVLKGDEQKADGSPVHTHMWEYFCAKAVLKGKDPDGGERPQRKVMPDKWKAALNGFRRLGIRWWRRNLVKTLLDWRRSTLPMKEPLSVEFLAKEYVDRNGVIHPVWRWRRAGTSNDFLGRKNYKEWFKAKVSSPAGRKSHEVAAEAIWRTAGEYCQDHPEVMEAWWSWVWGSTPLFWRWPEQYQADVRDGQPHFLVGDGKPYKRPQKAPRSEEDRKRVSAKVNSVRQKRYIAPGRVVSLIHFFYVPKGPDDIRIVYNGAGCRLNKVIWAPHFGLPTIRDVFRSLLPGYVQADIDIAECFLNFLLNDMLKEMSGVDVTTLEGEEGRKVWERWVRNWMGLRDSPFRSIQWMIRIKFEAYGDRKDDTNPFQYDRVELNLPGSKGYRPDLPWVMKIRKDGHLASDVYVYVDDGRTTGHDEDAAWAACRRFASVCSKYGVQDASHKRSFPSAVQGPWSGSVCHTDGGVVTVTVSQQRWDKTRGSIRELHSLVMAAEEQGGIPIQDLLSIRGFLQYVCRTYSWLTPYLKGVHLTIDSWRPGRDEEGYKLSAKVLRAMAEKEAMPLPCRREDEDAASLEEAAGAEEITPPERVQPVGRLLEDVEALLDLTSPAEPPKDAVRAQEAMVALYLPGDASGTGFGSAIISEEEGLLYEAGMWATSYAEESSNFREASNLVKKLVELVGGEKLKGREVFLITDNEVFERTYYKGHSTSKLLTGIIFQLRMAERDGGVKVHVVHVAGTRMKRMGIDGLSRGDLMEGMMAGQDPLSFFPFDEGANDRSGGKVKRWVDSWWKEWDGGPLVEMTPDLWFEARHVEGARLWMPPPAAMETVMEVFNEDRIAHPWNTHIFVVPRLMTHLWRRKLGRDADVLFYAATGNHFWEKSQHEPLIIALVFPYAYVHSYRGPWVVGETDMFDAVTSELHEGFKFAQKDGTGEFPKLARGVRDLWKDPEGRSRDLLQQLLASARKFPPVRECLVRGVLRGGCSGPISEASGVGGERGGKRTGSSGHSGDGPVQKRKKR